MSFTTSRTRIRSASPCLTFEPVRASSSPLLKLTPMSSRNECGQRYTLTVSDPVLTTAWLWRIGMQSIDNPDVAALGKHDLGFARICHAASTVEGRFTSVNVDQLPPD